MLADDAATTGQVIAALRALVGTVSGADTVVVYFSGHASKGRRVHDYGPYLILADTQLGPTVSGGVRPSELHTLLGCLLPPQTCWPYSTPTRTVPSTT